MKDAENEVIKHPLYTQMPKMKLKPWYEEWLEEQRKYGKKRKIPVFHPTLKGNR